MLIVHRYSFNQDIVVVKEIHVDTYNRAIPTLVRWITMVGWQYNACKQKQIIIFIACAMGWRYAKIFLRCHTVSRVGGSIIAWWLLETRISQHTGHVQSLGYADSTILVVQGQGSRVELKQFAFILSPVISRNRIVCPWLKHATRKARRQFGSTEHSFKGWQPELWGDQRHSKRSNVHYFKTVVIIITSYLFENRVTWSKPIDTGRC